MIGAPPRRLLAIAAFAAVALVGCGGSDDDGGDGGESSSGEPGTVQVKDNVFEPEELEIDAGDTVTWEFVGGALHNVQGDGFKSKNLKEGTFEHTFKSAGEFTYQCTLHPGMKGTVTVGR